MHSSLTDTLHTKGESTKLGSTGWSGYTKKVQFKEELAIVSRSVPQLAQVTLGTQVILTSGSLVTVLIPNNVNIETIYRKL